MKLAKMDMWISFGFMSSWINSVFPQLAHIFMEILLAYLILTTFYLQKIHNSANGLQIHIFIFIIM